MTKSEKKNPIHPFGQYLRELMASAINQRQISEATGIPETSITNMIKGKRLTGPQSRERILKIADYLYEEGVITQIGQVNQLLSKAGKSNLTLTPPQYYSDLQPNTAGIEIEVQLYLKLKQTVKTNTPLPQISSPPKKETTNKTFKKSYQYARFLIGSLALLIVISCIYGFITIKPSFITTKLSYHTKDVLQVDWNSDGSQLVSASSDGSIIMWNISMSTPQLTASGHDGNVRSVDWCSNNSKIASAGNDNLVFIWDTESKQVIQKLIGHINVVRTVSWNNECNRLLSGSEDHTAIMWDAISGQQIYQITEHYDWIRDMSWNADSSLFASISRDDHIIIWQPSDGKIINTLINYADTVVDWHPCDKNILAAGNERGEIIVWDITHDIPSHFFKTNREKITDLDWHPNGNILATTSTDRTIKVWDIASEKLLYSIYGRQKVWSVAWSPLGDYLASGDAGNQIGLWPFNKVGNEPCHVQ